jgi:hypothetical protein
MPTIVWLMTGAGVWLATVIATCGLLTAAARTDERQRALSRVLVDATAGGQAANDALGSRAARIHTIVLCAREPRPAGQVGARAAGERDPRPRGVRSAREHKRRAATSPAYALHVRGKPVGQLQWRNDPAWAAGWYVHQRRGWRRLAVDRDPITAFDAAASPRERQETAELAASVSTARALDAAAALLKGPPARPPSALCAGYYEVHVSGLGRDIVPIAFPETIVACHGSTSVLCGHFDDLGLAVLTRRIALLDGRVLALLHTPGPYA